MNVWRRRSDSSCACTPRTRPAKDTVLFPAIRKIVSKEEYEDLGERFEKKEHELFGEDVFEQIVDRVAAIEKTLGIYDLSQFTPNT